MENKIGLSIYIRGYMGILIYFSQNIPSLHYW